MKRTFGFLLVTLVGFAVESRAQPPATQIVTLLAKQSYGSVCPAGRNAASLVLNPDGSTSPLSIPHGKVIVITSADWFATTGRTGHYVFFIAMHGAFPAQYVVQGAGVQGGPGSVSGSLVMPTGFRFGPGVTLCVSMKGDFGPVQSVYARLHGYFADSPYQYGVFQP